MKNKIIARDYKEELASIAEAKGFRQDAENLLLSMFYKVEDSYQNYQTVKRAVPSKEEFMEAIVDNVRVNCQDIIIAEPGSQEEKELKENKVKIMTENDAKTTLKKVISYPNEKTLLYAISKMSLPPLVDNDSTENKAITTAINIGKCISNAETIRDFNGWTWSILSDEIESTECNVIYTFLTFLLGHSFFKDIQIYKIKNYVSEEFYEELKKVAIQFYVSYDKEENEKTLKKLAEDKIKLEKMKNQSGYIIEITENKKKRLIEIGRIDEILSNPKMLKQQYMHYNAKLPNERKIFSVSHYEDMLQNRRKKLLMELQEFNKKQNPNEFLREKEDLEYEIKLYEEKTDISKLSKEFLKAFSDIVNATEDKKKLIDLIYQIRYLNFLPNCKMDLRELEEKIIPRAIKFRAIAPISNNDSLDYKILKGIFNSQVVNLENLYIKLQAVENIIKVELFDGDMFESAYDVHLPEGSSIQIRKSKRMRVFE